MTLNSCKTLSFLLLTLLLSACVSQPKVGPTATEEDAITLLVLGPKPNPVKHCVVWSLELNHGLTLFRLSKASNQSVRQNLTTGITDPDIALLRKKQISAWEAGGTPAELSEMSLNYCLNKNNISLELGPLGRTCFSHAGIPARVEAQKAMAVPKDEAVVESQRAFASQLPAEYVREIVEDVYSRDAKKDEYLAHRKVFVKCIRRGR